MKGITPAAIRSTYRRLLRMVEKTGAGQHQLYSYRHQRDPHTFKLNPVEIPVQPLLVYDPTYKNQVRAVYKKHSSLTSTEQIQKHHLFATTMLEMYDSNLAHSQALVHGGWSLRQTSANAVKSVARRVGLEVTDAPVIVDDEMNNKSQVATKASF